MTKRPLCGFIPYPGLAGEYGRWRCGRRRWHLGRHRVGEFTMPRVPRFWHVRALWRSAHLERAYRRLYAMQGRDWDQRRAGRRTALYPLRDDPLSVSVQPSRAATALSQFLDGIDWNQVDHD